MNVAAILEVDKIVKKFGGLRALDGVSFSLEEKEILGVIGPNGSGKTTLFNVISGFLTPDEGKVSLLGKQITGFKPHTICHYGLARVFQLVHPFTGLTTIQNVMAGRICGPRRAPSIKTAISQAESILDFLSLSEQKALLAANLSLPDRKRLEVARALATEPKILLLDEVMAGLNPKETLEALKLLRQINSSGITLIVVEHNVKAILSICTQVLVLNVGKKIAEGKPEKIVNEPQVVEAYLGKGTIS
jgi:branched-chain amino acid transport system ATP-binding protein